PHRNQVAELLEDGELPPGCVDVFFHPCRVAGFEPSTQPNFLITLWDASVMFNTKGAIFGEARQSNQLSLRVNIH
ncbi:MAG: hypothetical protein ACKO3N_20785, partial [Verrucomicrobiota bacterium]